MKRFLGLALLTVFALPVSVTVAARGGLAHRSAEREGGPTRMLRSPSIGATSVAFVYANNIWVVERGGGNARRLTSFQGQTTNPKFSPDGATVAFSGDYGGNVDVYTVPSEGGEPKRLTWHPGADQVQGWTADGASVMFASPRATAAPSATPRFWTVPAKGGVEVPLALPRGYQGKISPDGRRIAYRMNTSWDEERRNYRGGQNRPVWIVDLKTFDLVSPPWIDSKDVDPVWLGDTVFFISDRDGMANVWSYDTATKATTQRTKFIDYDVKSLDAGAGTVVFEQAGWLHTPDSNKLLYTDTNLNVWVMDIATGQAKIVGNDPWMVPQRTLFPTWSPDSKWVAFASRLNTLYRAIVVANVETGEKTQVTDGLADAMYLVDADKAVPAEGQGRIDVTLRMHLDPKAEFAQIFNEGWRLQRDYLYVPNMHGTNWPRMKEMYGAMLPHIAHRADLNYLLDNMGAEIAIGHSYVRGGAMPEVPASPGGLLGADFTVENGRYKIAKIYDGESWNPELRAPLAGPGINVSVGDYILAINGLDLVAPDNIYRLLEGSANRQTVLTVNAQPAAQGARQVTVVPVPGEQGLRTRAWVEENRRFVDKRSNGQLAYVYVPNTGQGGFESFNRYYFAQQDKQGAVIDERYNGGGSAADYIIDVLQRDFDGYFNNVAGDRRPFTSPSAGIWGPKVMIINEMAGSGGDLMPWMFRYRKIGPLVGKRTWGGLVHTADTPGFIDGGSMIAPRGGFFTRDGKWAVENEGTAPDIDVENWPKDVIAGRDPQLERAVDEALRLLKEKPVDRRTTEPAPPTWGKRPGGN